MLVQLKKPGFWVERDCLTAALVIRSLRLEGLLYATIGGVSKIVLLLGSCRRMFWYLHKRILGKFLRLGWKVMGKVTLLFGALGSYAKALLRDMDLTLERAGLMYFGGYPQDLKYPSVS